jgi:hypothetical protein
MLQLAPDSINQIVCGQPFSGPPVCSFMDEGPTVADLVDASGVSFCYAPFIRVHINEVPIPVEYWRRVRPRAGAVVSIFVRPQGGGGGGGKSPFRIVAMIAVVALSIVAPYLAPGLATSLGGALGASTAVATGASVTTSAAFGLGAAIIGGAITVVGNMAINAMLPVPTPVGRENFGGSAMSTPAFSFTGTSNRYIPYGPIPRVVGRRKLYPVMAAVPYTEPQGNDQYLRLLLTCGWGPVDISDLKIGDSAISSFAEVEYEVREGWSDDTAITLYTRDVNEDTFNASLVKADTTVVTAVGTALPGDDSWVQETTEADTDIGIVSINFPSGLGDPAPATVNFEVEYSVVGEADWKDVVWTAGTGGDFAVNGAIEVTANTAASYDTIGTFSVVSGVYDIRVRRLTDAVGDTSNWTSLTSTSEGWVGKVTTIETTEIGVDVACPTGLRIIHATEGTPFPDTVVMEVEYSVLGANTWVEAEWINNAEEGFTVDGQITITDSTSSVVRRGGRFLTPAAGQYDVRVRRTTTNNVAENIFNDTSWTALRSKKDDAPVTQTGLSFIAIRMKATEQLNGSVDQINCVATSYLPVYDNTSGGSFSWELSRNPAWAALHFLRYQGDARLIADSKINLDDFLDWADACDVLATDGKPYWQCDSVLEGGTVREAFRNVAAHGRARITSVDGLYTITRDIVQTIPRQHISPRNSWGYEGEKVFLDYPHALKVRFINPALGWQEDERIVYDDGYGEENATDFEVVDMLACTEPGQAWRDGRYHLAAAKLRPEVHKINMDIENLRVTSGDLVRFAHDVILVGLAWGRVKSRIDDGSVVTSYTTDEQFPMVLGSSYAVAGRLSDGTESAFTVVTNPGNQTTFTPTTPTPVATAPDVGDLLFFGVSGLEYLDCVVKEIEHNNDYVAKLTLVDYAPAIFTADTGTIPAYDSKITNQLPQTNNPPSTPNISGMRSDESVLLRLPDGTLQSRILVDMQPGAPGSITGDVYHTQYKESSSAKWEDMPTVTTDSVSIFIFPVQDTVSYDVRIRAVAQGLFSAWTTETGHIVVGKTSNPPDVEDFTVNIIGDVAAITWTAVNSLDISHYRIKFAPVLTGAAWDSSGDIAPRVEGTSKVLPALVGTYLIKAVDVTGLESDDAALIVSNVAGLTNFNVVQTIAEGPDFGGVHDDTVVIDSILQLAGSTFISEWTTLDVVKSMAFGIDGGFVSTGTYYFEDDVDLGAEYTARVETSSPTGPEDPFNTMDLWTTLADVTAMAGESTSVWTVMVQERHTSDDPTVSGATWTSWSNLVIGDYTFWGMEFRAVLATASSTITPAVTDLDVTIDMPDRVHGANNFTIPAIGLSVAFAPAFKATPAIALSVEDMATGDYFEITGQDAEGFDVIVKNSGGTGVERVGDYVARGYGAAV